MRSLLFAVLALISILIAAFFFYSYVNQRSGDEGMSKFILAAVFALLAIVFGGLFLSGRVNRTEDIHITE